MVISLCLITLFMLFGSIDHTKVPQSSVVVVSVPISSVISGENSTDTTYVNHLNASAHAYFAQNGAALDTGIVYAKRAFALAETLAFKRGMAEALNIIAYQQVLEGKIEQGLEAGFHQLRLAEELADQRLIAKAQLNIGFASGQQSQRDSAAISEARERLNKALATGKKLQDDFLIAFAYNALGRLARVEGRQEEALALHYEALRLATALHNPEHTSWALHSLGAIYEAQKQYPRALDYAQKAYGIRKKAGLFSGVVTSLRLMGLVYFRQGHYEQAKRCAKECIMLSKGRDGLFVIKIQSYQLLSDVYAALHKPGLALEWYKEYTATKDSAAAIESKNNILQLQAQIDLERKEREKSAFLLEAGLQNARLQRQYIIGVVIIGCVALLSIAVVLLLRTNQVKKKQNEELQNAYQEIQKQQGILEGQAQEIEVTNTQLQEINETLKESNSALDEANTFKVNMLSIAAHDLKNPLHTIANFSELILDDLGAHSGSTKAFAERISSICARMLALIHDLLDTASHDLGKMSLQIQPVNIGDLAHAVTEQYTLPAEEKGQQILHECSPECWVEGDVQRLYQVLENLLSNAVKYSPMGKCIWLQAVVLPERETVRLSVRDEGPGISREDQEKAFVMFQRLSAITTGGENSTGVGLALVKQIVQLHGGRVWIESTLGEGSEFIVELPLRYTPA